MSRHSRSHTGASRTATAHGGDDDSPLHAPAPIHTSDIPLLIRARHAEHAGMPVYRVGCAILSTAKARTRVSRGNERRSLTRSRTRSLPLCAGAKPFRCAEPGCTYASPDAGAVSRHRRQHLSPDDDATYPTRCTFPGCSHRTHDFSNLARRMKTHTGERQYKCPYPGCGYTAIQKPTLVSHVRRRHIRRRDFPCQMPGCGYAAFDPSDLRTHARHCSAGAKRSRVEGMPQPSPPRDKEQARRRQEEVPELVRERLPEQQPQQLPKEQTGAILFNLAALLAQALEPQQQRVCTVWL
jgi:hypothetical protein